MAKVESIAKFSFVADGKVYRYDEVTVNKATIIPGAELDLSGGKSVATMAAPVVDTERAKRFVAKFEKKETTAMTKDDYWRNREERDIETGIRIRRSGVIQVAVQIMADFEKAEELANRMLEFINK